ncbi:NADH-ubiquinone oxidoreductase-F iron-sulfur binding region domain-containing protein [Natrarchaeobius oligotrophus]|uniref:NADH dehydrogenase FAD-containing subunit n=1 Tax=Natrarchaeobius chitinivorans TaxID=1679083 RepID=A0A3N6MHF5_NATCH|nr:NADH-ubiquinone oxidoreductase-F iron-sulfur binding region domain-containing protein [Natrarchaeobius chitinivorans]RQH02558.1 NADH dehydrogenase FAD-containing subunit [Natrarchaeobius chitinivorans]
MTDEPGAVRRSPVVRVAADVSSQRADRVCAAARDAATSVPVVRTGPTGVDDLEPLLLATDGGRTALFSDPSPSAVSDLVIEFESDGVPVAAADATVDHDPDASALATPETGALSVGCRRVLEPCGWVDPLEPTDYALRSDERHAGAVANVGIRGRGRGDAREDEPAAEAWELVRETDGEPVVVVNANEPDDRHRADRTLLAGAPIAVLDGVAAVAAYVGAEDAVIYLNEGDEGLERHLRRAVDAAADALSIAPEVVVGPDEYRAGAPTAALEAMEGADRIEPRRQPPTPAEYGLYGRPTIVHTPRTFAQVQRALRDPDSFDADAPDPGTRLVTVTGDVDAPTTVELETTTELAAVRDAVSMTGAFKMACVGGVFGGITADLDVVASEPALAAAGLGTDGVVELLNDGRCPVATAGERARFASLENSGRCVPGREGTKQLTELLRETYRGSFRSDEIRELGRVMSRSSNCRIGACAPRPVLSAMNEFEPEFRVHADGRCPSGTCSENL